MTPELNKNLQALAGRFPEVIEELKSHAHSRPDPKNLPDYFNTIYGPQKLNELLERWVKIADKSELHIHLTTGFGDGTHVEALLDTIPENSRVCVLECDPALFLTTLAQGDFSRLLSDVRFIILTPFCYREVIARLNIELIGIQSTAVHLYAPIYNRNPDLHKNVLSMVLRQLTTRWNQIKTDVENAEVVFKNSLENFGHIGFGSNALALQGIFENKPLVLVGAGPSLDESFEFLKSIQGKAVIAVVNSAYRAVVNQGIKPDLTVAVDPNEGTFKGYKGTNTEGVPLICTYLVYPEVVRAFSGRIFPLSSFNYLMSFVRRVLQFPEEPGIVGDGTVSSTIVNLGFFFGCSEIYLVGQDLAIRKDGRTHTLDSFYSDDNLNFQDLSDCVWLEGNSGEKVPVERKLHAYLKIFENQVSQMNSIQFYNLSKNGAKIHGAKYLDYEEASAFIQRAPETNYRELLLQKATQHKVPENAQKAANLLFERYHGYMTSMLKVLMKFSVKGEITTDLHPKTMIELTDEKSEIASIHKEVVELFTSNPLFTSMLVEGRSKKEYFDFISSGEKWSLITNESATLAEMLPQAWALVEGIVFQIENIERYILEQ